MKTPLPRNQGFTLIELFVTIGIIAVLSALVLAVNTRVTRQAKTVQCTDNLRQLGLAFLSYAADHDGSIPAPQGNYLNDKTPSASWAIVMQDYLSMNFPKVGEKNVFLCPVALDTFANRSVRRSYGMNSAGTDGKTPFRLAAIGKPSATLLLADTRDNGTGQGDGVSSFGINNYLTSMDWRHDSAVNVLLFDGHIEAVAKKNTTQLDTYVRNLIP